MKPTTERPSEAEVKRALQGILVNRDARAVNWAVAYARAGLDLEGEDLRVQCLYILNNITRWRGDTAHSGSGHSQGVHH